MNEYTHNCFVEDVIYKNFSDVCDSRRTYKCLYTLCEYYNNRITLAKLANANLNMLVYDIVNSIHEIYAHMNNILVDEFMILCDCFNTINAYYNIDTRIDFDNYTDIENAIITYYDYSDMSTHRREFAFYDFQYCNINLIEYIRQYEKHDVYYYSHRYEY